MEVLYWIEKCTYFNKRLIPYCWRYFSNLSCINAKCFPKSTDAGISKTVNSPNEATIEDVENAYILAWETKCKGIAIYGLVQDKLKY